MIRVATLAGAVLLAGCASATMGLGAGSEVKILDSGVVVTTGQCPYGISPETGVYEQRGCGPAVILAADDPRGVELWQFEARVKQLGPYGIPAGRRPMDVLVAGERDRCEAVRARVATQGIPTEACELTRLRIAPGGIPAAPR
ncbi:MAG TPA: hypothetical protein VGL09_20165 [Methylomirabilota bacterium]|jgi:hypothetical protein